MRSISAGLSPRIARRPNPCRSLKPGWAPMATPLRFAVSAVRNMMEGSPAWKPQAMLADDTMSSIASSSPMGQGPKPSPMSQLRSIFMASHQHRLRALLAHMEHALVAFDLGLRPHGLGGIVGELHGGAPVRRDHLAHDGDGIEPAVRREPAEIVGEQGAPAIADAHAAAEMAVDALDHVHVEAVGEDEIGRAHV